MVKKYDNDRVDDGCNVLMKHAFTLAEALLIQHYPTMKADERATKANHLAMKSLKNLLTPTSAVSQTRTEPGPVLH